MTKAPKPFEYFPKYHYRLQWRRVKECAPAKAYWLIYRDGVHVGELFQGKSGYWFSAVFGRAMLRDKDFDNLILHTTALIIGGNN